MVARTLAAPHRTPPTLSDAIRAALRVAADMMQCNPTEKHV